MSFSLVHSFPRLRHSLTPTPLHRLAGLSTHLGRDVWCKRDDLTGFGFGGNKTRKLDFLVGEARMLGATDLVAPGGVQSNFCRIAAAYASATGMGCHLVLGGSERHDSEQGNVVLSRLFGAELHRVRTDDWNDWERRTREITDELTAAGREPYPLRVGGSTSTGACGYVLAMEELTAQFASIGITIDAIVHASSSGGTQAGLLAGGSLARWPGTVIGIAVAKSQAQLSAEVLALARGTAERCGTAVREQDVVLDERFIGEGYAIPSSEALEAQRLFARLEGIVLDGVYTAKAAAGLIAHSDELPRDASILFLHTGGTPEVFS